MPSRQKLPDGPRREFVEELRRHWRDAGRPPLRKVSRALEGRTDLKEVTASTETIRRMLTGAVLTTDRDRVYAVFVTLCEMAGTEPHGQRWNDPYSDEETNWQCLRRLWDTALEEDAAAPSQPRSGFSQDKGDDPWAADGEPPF
jgi:hypothetical protein